jgi:hypothetical protein
VISCVLVEVLPQTSVAVQVLVIVNLLAQITEEFASATVTVTVPAQLSVAVTEPIEAAGTKAAQLTVRAAGVPVITGLILSFTVISCVLVDVFPQISVAVHVRVIVYLLAQITEEFTSETVVLTTPPQLSVAVMAVAEATGTRAAQLTVRAVGVPVITGGVTSGLTVNVDEHVVINGWQVFV